VLEYCYGSLCEVDSVTGVPIRSRVCRLARDWAPSGAWAISGASIQASRTVMRRPWSSTRIVSPSPIESTVALTSRPATAAMVIATASNRAATWGGFRCIGTYQRCCPLEVPALNTLPQLTAFCFSWATS
jgi:SH3-like domain-containing protein